MSQKRNIKKDIKLRVTDELHTRLARICAINSQPMAAQIRTYINDGLKRDETILEGGAGIDSGEQISCFESSEQDNRLRRGKT